MPDIGEGLTEAEIIKWFVKVGDTVDLDQILVEIETAKTVVEIPSPFAGTVTSIAVHEGEIVEVDAVLFVIGGEVGATPSGASGESGNSLQDRVPPESVTETPIRSAVSVPSTSGVRPRAMPIIRKLAKERGIDLALITGSGPGGAITRTDLETQSSVPGHVPDAVPLSRTRQTIADHMTKSWRAIPHVTVQAELRAEQLLAGRDDGSDSPLPIEPLIAQVVMPLLRAYPEFNAEYADNGMVVKPGVHMGFAVDTEAGLMVVVVKDADRLSVSALAAEFQRLAQAAKDRTITLDEITGQTFTISNIGALGGGHGTPIIPLGTSSIMSIGRAKLQPVVENGELAVGLVAPVDLSYDHRLIDGSLGQRFLSDLVTGLESFVLT
jgi:2-oxoisovalerate dehydrogenase E2 component (dihydrolipoyl transacylase)